MLKEWLDTEVGKRRSEEYRAELAVQYLVKIKLIRSSVKQLYILIKLIIIDKAYSILKLRSI